LDSALLLCSLGDDDNGDNLPLPFVWTLHFELCTIFMETYRMSRRYSPDHKALVLKILKAYKDDVVAASRYTGVPERTLREWRHEEHEMAALKGRAAVQGRKLSQRQP
jgi:hypothetical protein